MEGRREGERTKKRKEKGGREQGLDGGKEERRVRDKGGEEEE